MRLSATHFLNAAHFLDHYVLLIFPTAVLAIHREWGLSYAEALGLGTPAFFVFAVATPLSGWLGDRWGGRQMMTVFFFGAGISTALCGLATGPLGLAAALAAVGLFASIYHPVGTALVVRSAARRGRALGLNGVFGNLGVAAAALVTAWVTARFGWRASFVLPGAVACLAGVGYLFSREPAETAAVAGAQPAFAAPDGQVRILVVVAVASLLGGAVFNGLTVSLPKLFAERLEGSGLAAIGSYVSLVFAIAAFAQIPVGRLLDRVGARPIMLTLTSLQAVLLVALAYAEGPLAVLVAAPLMLAVFGEIPTASWLASHAVAPHWRSRAFSVQFLLSLGIGAGVVPFLALAHARTGSMTLALVVFAAAAALITVTTALLLPRIRDAGAAAALAEAEGRAGA